MKQHQGSCQHGLEPTDVESRTRGVFFQARFSHPLTLALAALTLSPIGCSVDGSPTASMRSAVALPAPSIRQTDSHGVPLPFITTFPDRWSAANSGTTYEPCTALTSSELLAAGIDPSTARDAAVVNHQTLRGCNWFYAGGQESGSLSHFTGNTPTFEQDMEDRSRFEVTYDITLAGRHVMVDSADSVACETTVKSGRSPVTVIVSKLFKPIGREAVCKRAIDFMRIVIDRMPPADR